MSADAAKPYVLWTVILASSLAIMDGTVVSVALPQMRESLGASLAEMQWVMNAYALTLSAFMLNGGAAGDFYGLKRVFMLGILVFGVASLCCALASSAAVLIAARAVQGIGGALMVPGSLALISASFPPKERGKAIGAWAAASGIAAALGPILGGWLVDIGPWSAIFWINLPVAAFSLWLCWRYVPETRRTGKGGMDWLGGVLAILGLGALAFGLTSLGERNTNRGLDLTSALIGVGLILAFVLHERRTRAPMMPLDLFRIPAFASVNALTLLLYFALNGALFFLPTTLIEAHGYAAVRAGSVFLPFTIVMAMLSRWGGALADRFGVRTFLTVGPILTGLSMALLYPAVRNGGWSAILPVMVLMGLGMGLTVAPLSTTVMNAVSTEHAGTASGINNAVARIAGLIAVASLGAVATIGFQTTIAAADPGIAQMLARATFGAPAPTDGSAPTTIRALYAQATIDGFGLIAMISAGAAMLGGYFGHRASGAHLSSRGA